jgi:hypothetical protein
MYVLWPLAVEEWWRQDSAAARRVRAQRQVEAPRVWQRARALAALAPKKHLFQKAEQPEEQESSQKRALARMKKEVEVPGAK